MRSATIPAPAVSRNSHLWLLSAGEQFEIVYYSDGSDVVAELVSSAGIVSCPIEAVFDGRYVVHGPASCLGRPGALGVAVGMFFTDGITTSEDVWPANGGLGVSRRNAQGSTASVRLNKPITGMVPNGNGYLMVGEDGGIFNFSAMPFLGSLGANPPAFPIVSVAVLDES